MSGMDLWDGAVRDALTETPADLTAAVRDELRNMWADLYHERRFAHNGQWSIKCDQLVYRIVILSRLVGATEWDGIQIELLEDGIYQGILQAACIEFEPPDMTRVAEVRERSRARNRQLRGDLLT